MEDCIVLARTLGERVGTELEIPVFLYERAATTPARENLADVRRGEFEGIRDEMNAGAANRKPDFGPSQIHADRRRRRDRRASVPRRLQRLPRPGDRICRSRRTSRKRCAARRGGLRYVKGLGLEVDGQAQVSMNLVDTEKTPLYRAFDMVKMEARSAGRVADVERDRRARAGAGAVRDRGAAHPAARLQAGDGAREQGARRRPGRRVAHRIRRRRSRRRRRRPAAAASPRTSARSAPRSRRWSPVSPPARRSTSRSTPRCASSRSRPRAS